MKQTTLLLLLKNNQILLAMKKRGFGANRWNGVGGKIEPDETIEQAAIRECQEEIGVTPKALEKVAHHTFLLSSLTDFDQTMITHTFVARDWEGDPTESDEMAPQWFNLDEIPYDSMWEDDKFWLPHVLAGKRLVCTFGFDENDRMTTKEIIEVEKDHELLV